MTAALAAASFAAMAASGPSVAEAASCTKPVQRYYNPDRVRTTESLCANYLERHGWRLYALTSSASTNWFWLVRR